MMSEFATPVSAVNAPRVDDHHRRDHRYICVSVASGDFAFSPLSRRDHDRRRGSVIAALRASECEVRACAKRRGDSADRVNRLAGGCRPHAGFVQADAAIGAEIGLRLESPGLNPAAERMILTKVGNFISPVNNPAPFEGM
jgi:hypothetical protein